jgi:hypothetical protein
MARSTSPTHPARRWHRALAVAVGSALTVVATAVPAAASPTTDAADWLSSQLVGPGSDHYEEFGSPSAGLTADGALAFDAAGYATEASATTAWLADPVNINGYIGTGGANYPGGLAKVALVALASGGNPSSWGSGSIDLITRLKSTLVTSGADAGRFADPRDTPTYFGYANPTVQALAILVIQDADPTWAGLASATSYLRSQACTDDGWTYEFPATTCTSSDPDSTGVAVQALSYVGGSANDTAATDANTWLVTEAVSQAPNGAAWQNICRSPWTTPEPSANSTALAIGGLLADPAGPSTHAATIGAGVTWLEYAQTDQSDGGLPACTDAGASDVRATTQGLLGLASLNYVDLL